MSKRSAEVVRAELREVQRQITGFGSFASKAEQLEGILAYFTNVSGRIDPSRLREYFGNDPLALQAAKDLEAIQRLLRYPELADRAESLRVCLCGLVQGLYDQQRILKRELAALEPMPEPEPGFWRRLWQSVLRFLDAWPAWWELFAEET